MSPFQFAKELRGTVRGATWADAPQAVIIGDSCYVTAGVRDDDDLPARLPFALISLGTQNPDAEDPSLLTQEFILVVACQVLGDPLGEHSLIGGPSGQGATNRFGRSEGRGLLELETALLTAVGRMTGADGTPILVSQGSSPAPERLGNNVHLVHRQYLLTAVCTRADEYPAPQDFTAANGVGSSALAWTLPAATYGRRQIVVRYLAGAVAPASATAGTGVTLASDLATSVTATLAAGTYSFAVFCGYTESGAATNEKFSSQVTGTTRLSVVVS